MKIIMVCLVGVYLIVMSVLDFWKRQIPVLPGVICIGVVSGCQFFLGTSWKNWVPGAILGALLFLICKLSRESIGSGDALIYVVTGLCLGFMKNLDLLVLSLFMAAVIGGTLLLFGRVGKKYAMPFIPFTAVSYGVLTFCEMGGVWL